jgi:hypothetical protein
LKHRRAQQAKAKIHDRTLQQLKKRLHRMWQRAARHRLDLQHALMQFRVCDRRGDEPVDVEATSDRQIAR